MFLLKHFIFYKEKNTCKLSKPRKSGFSSLLVSNPAPVYFTYVSPKLGTLCFTYYINIKRLHKQPKTKS